MDELKKILVVAYHFPPDAEVGALRPQKFVKYLPEFGWQPYVLTLKDRFIERRDDARLADVGHAEIHRINFCRTPQKLLLDIRDYWRTRSAGLNSKLTTPPPGEAEGMPQFSQSLGGKVLALLASLNWFPDDKMYWTIPAVVAGYRLIRRESIGVVYATSPPHTVALIGYFLVLLTKARLIIDFRDPWKWFQSKNSSMRWWLYDLLEECCESLVVKRAESVICTTERLSAALRIRYPNEPSCKFVTIPNGYDADDIERSKDTARVGDKYIISYLGTFYLERNPENFLRALKRAINEGVIPEHGVEVRFIGNVRSVRGKPLKILLDECSMAGIVRVAEPVSHQEAIQQMREADLLLLLAPSYEYQIPAKTFEYIGVQRPILALTGAGATADLVREVNAGLIVEQDDIDGIYEALLEMYENRSSVRRKWYKDIDTSRFERKSLTRRFAEVLRATLVK